MLAFKITFLNYKHNYNQCPFSTVIHVRVGLCPAWFPLAYLDLRENSPGALLQPSTEVPIPRVSFSSLLSQAIKYCGLDPSCYKGHSFQMGAASHAAD